MRLQYPQAALRVTATVQLSRTRDELQDVTFICRPRSLTLERNDYTTADVLTVELDAAVFPVLPRLIRQVHVQAYAGDAGTIDEDEIGILTDEHLVFMGYIDEPELQMGEQDAKILWKGRDYTGVLLDTKRPSVDLVPLVSDNLHTALRRILDDIPGGENISLRLDGLDAWPEISKGVLSGLKDAKVSVKPEDTAWNLIKRACDPLALIPRIDLDELVVSTSRGIFTPSRRPVFMYGRNVAEYSEKRRLTMIREGIGLSAYSLADQKQIVAVYPPPGDRQIAKHLKKQVTKKKGKPKLSTSIKGTDDKRKWFPYGVVADQETLDDAAEAVFERRRRLEFEGTFVTHAMLASDDIESLDETDEPDFDVTKIGNADQVMIAIEPGYRAILQGLQTTEQRVQLLVDDGYDPEVASVLVTALEAGVDGGLAVYVKTATHSYSETDGYKLSVSFLNLISDAAA